MSILATQTVTQAGLIPAMTSCSSSGDQFQPASTTILLFVNDGGTAEDVTVAVTATAYGQPVSDVEVVVPAGGQAVCGPYDPGEVAAAQTGLASISYSNATPLTVAVLSI
jgi:hypothetical protein